MLTIEIDDPELEQNIKQTYGDDMRSLAGAFSEFLKQQRIRQDVGVSIRQLDKGGGIPMARAINDICLQYV